LQPTAIIFDLGGVILLRSDQPGRKRWSERLGISKDQLQETVWGAIGPGGPPPRAAAEVCQRISAATGLSGDDAGQLLADFHAHWRLDPQLWPFIEIIHGRYRTAMIANAGHATRFAINNVLHIDSVFDPIVISAEEGVEKPNKRIYRLAADRLRVTPAQCIFVDDRPENVVGAESAGMIGVHHVAAGETICRVRELLGFRQGTAR
jgi:FMN phosphatase YigB (HAD superfamily)